MKNLKFLEKLFSVKNSISKKHKIITFLGIKINIRRKNKFKKQIDELFKNIRKKSVLIVEPNDCHYEVIPGYAKYLKQLGYNVDIVLRRERQLDFLKASDPDIRVYSMENDICSVLEDSRLKKYRYLLFSSSVRYVSGMPGNSPEQPLVTNFFEKIDFSQDKIIFVQHHMERKTNFKNQIALADLHNEYSKNFLMVNPHYFGKIEITPKSNDITKFIVVGNISPWRKNFSLLLNAIKDLSLKTDKFKVIVVGSGELKGISEDIVKFFDVRGRLSYEDMFKAMEEADFFLCLLDPESEDHQRYITVGTSGGFQLVYGFEKPCLIQKNFADVYGFDNTNALVYEKNEDLSVEMLKAIDMSSKDYDDKQKQIAMRAEKIRNLSLDNLRKILI